MRKASHGRTLVEQRGISGRQRTHREEPAAISRAGLQSIRDGADGDRRQVLVLCSFVLVKAETDSTKRQGGSQYNFGVRKWGSRFLMVKTRGVLAMEFMSEQIAERV